MADKDLVQAVKAIVLGVGTYAVYSYVIMLLWNFIVADVFTNINTVTFWDVIGLQFLMSMILMPYIFILRHDNEDDSPA